MKFCLIGERLSHSYSAEIHKKCGIDYALCEVPRGGLKEFIARGYDGFNVTIPYKKEIIPYLDGLDESARAIGAVNTAVKRNGGYYGYNTDLAGMRYAFSRKGVSLKGRRIMILGSGGTSDTAKALCDAEGAKTCVKVSRFGEINYENCYNLTDTEIIINATPVGTFPNIAESPLDFSPSGFTIIPTIIATSLISSAVRKFISASGFHRVELPSLTSGANFITF